MGVFGGNKAGDPRAAQFRGRFGRPPLPEKTWCGRVLTDKKKPVQEGSKYAQFKLATGLEKSPEVSVPASYYMPPALLVTPPVGVATAEAYGWVDAARQSAARRGAVALDLDALSRWGDIGRMAGNDFESAVFPHLPEVRAAFETLVLTRPLVCRMSGSGSALFAVYRSARDRDDAQMMLGRKHGRLDSVETLASPVAPPAVATAERR